MEDTRTTMQNEADLVIDSTDDFKDYQPLD